MVGQQLGLNSFGLTELKTIGDLFAVSWNEGRKDKKTKKIARKNPICTCSTTLPGKGHFKRRWTVHEDGSATSYRVGIPRPNCHDDYFSGAQKIDVHNHLRQGSLKCDERPTHRWEIRMFQTILGMCEVDAYLAYKHFCPQQADRPHKSFLKRVILGLIHNKYGVGSDGPVLRPRNSSVSAGETTGQGSDASAGVSPREASRHSVVSRSGSISWR